jgi:glutamate carboxypeptidase
MLRQVADWAQINTGTHNLDGLARLSAAVERQFASLDVQPEYFDLSQFEATDALGRAAQAPLGRAMRLVKRPDAPLKVLLCIHLDTVFPPDHPFQKITRLDSNTLRGPGVADAKGGLVVLLTALQAFEQTPVASNLGWEVLLNPDEEIGSPGSAALLAEAARRNHIGLVFEPALPDGSLVGARKGSGNFTVVVRGRAAHAGRDFHLGRSAILAVADYIRRLDAGHSDLPGVTINCGVVAGGSALNVVPDLAIARFNIRVTRPQEQQTIEQRVAALAEEISKRDGVAVSVHGGFHSPPKPLDARSSRLFEAIESCGQEIGLRLEIHPSGGACDGNRLAAAGLPVIDTMGPRGGHLHSDQEYILIDSLAERAKLTALLLVKLASGEARV